ncbi:glycosyltransferase family 4 protein [Candidatus Daviesbacteria bacterium]|nr:glycosyltransferase family 4 protein [Candidatus Daviesbacteria bacterium]
MKILQLTAHFRPNIGGVETHLSDLCKALTERGFEVTVLTYRPLETDLKWKMLEREKNLTIVRIPWIPRLFYRLIKLPILEFIYLFPGLFLATPFVLLWKKIDVISAHGIVAGFVGAFWGKVFGKRVVISTHSIYNFPKAGLYRKFVTWIFKNASFCLGLSKQSEKEISSLGISSQKVNSFTYWIDLDKFKVKKRLGRSGKFTVLFVGRLVKEKGILELLESVKTWNKNINLKIIGSGPLEKKIKRAAGKYKNVEFIGIIDPDQLPLYYSGSDILIVPSLAEEGFGRVILESLACGTPVIGSNRGAIPEAMDGTVGRLIDVTPSHIKEAVEYFFNNQEKLRELAQNCRRFAERRYSEKNVEKIIRAYYQR